MACGEKSVTAIAQWARLAEDDQPLLAALGARRHPVTGRYYAPHADTFGRAFAAVDAQSLDDVSGAWMLEQLSAAGHGPSQDPSCGGTADGPPVRPGFAVDGKAVRGTIGQDGTMVHLLSAFAHQAGVSSQWLEAAVPPVPSAAATQGNSGNFRVSTVSALIPGSAS